MTKLRQIYTGYVSILLLCFLMMPNPASAEVCGDGIIDPGEECDDGNNMNGDGCTAACLIDRCDGFVPVQTTCGMGECAKAGETTCDPATGVIGDSCSPGNPVAEVCDALDNDCDGSVDNGIPTIPSTSICGEGVCAAAGIIECIGGVEVESCLPSPQDEATDMTCDGLDGDCDGSIDEDYEVDDSCGTGQCQDTNVPSSCGGGVETLCAQGTPDAEGPFGDPTCEDTIDNDCDNAVDADDFDCVDLAPPTPEELITELVNVVIELNLQHGISNALDSKLDNVLKALEDANANNDVSAINALFAFINSVEAQRGKTISDADADSLIAAAQAIIDSLT